MIIIKGKMKWNGKNRFKVEELLIEDPPQIHSTHRMLGHPVQSYPMFRVIYVFVIVTKIIKQITIRVERWKKIWKKKRLMKTWLL